ncbi:MAG: Gfo/Idh/MocA family oxidoreductase [Planctomycetota bacterium]
MQRPRIVFVGGAGHHYLRHALAAPGDGLFVVDDADEQATRALADRLGVAVHDGDLASAVAALEPDVVSIGSVHGHGGDHAATALRLGIPTVVDKPAAARWDQLHTLEALTARPDTPPLITEFDWRARPSLRAARSAVASGQLGDVTLIVAQKTYKFGKRPAWYADRKLYGGTMLWVASHAIDAIRFVMGCGTDDGERDVTVVAARHGNAGRPEIGSGEDHAVAVLDLGGGKGGGGTAIAHADLCRPAAAAAHGEDRLIIRGSRGELTVLDDTCTLTTHDQPTQQLDLPSLPPIHDQLLAAALSTDHDVFSTTQSLSTARQLLKARDLADGTG